MIDIRKLKELVKLMVENDLTELDLRDEQETVVVRRPTPGGQAAPGHHAAQPVVHHQVAPQPAAQQQAAPAAAEAEVDDEAGLVAISSPMVGTFYSSPDPESPTYVSVGDRVKADTVVCIVEAMKVFSEIKAETSGTIEKVLVKNAEPVEYGQKLFLVRPD